MHSPIGYDRLSRHRQFKFFESDQAAWIVSLTNDSRCLYTIDGEPVSDSGYYDLDGVWFLNSENKARKVCPYRYTKLLFPSWSPASATCRNSSIVAARMRTKKASRTSSFSTHVWRTT